MRQAFAPVGTRLRKAAATEDGGEGVLGSAVARAGGHILFPFPLVGVGARAEAKPSEGG